MAGIQQRDISPERNIFGRSGRLFKLPILTDSAGNQKPGQLEWLANVTEITATMTIDRLEVRRSGDYFVKYKPGEVTGEGSLTFDKVDSSFEKDFVDHVNAIKTGATNLPSYYLHVTLEDPGIPNIQYDSNTGFAKSGHEHVILKCVTFWSMPFGYSTTDVVTRSVDFTFNGIEFGSDGTNKHIIQEPTVLPVRFC